MILVAGATSAQAQPVEIDFWHAMGGELGDRTQEVVDGFNASQDEFRVNAVYRGNYTETLTSAIAAFRAGGNSRIWSRSSKSARPR